MKAEKIIIAILVAVMLYLTYLALFQPPLQYNCSDFKNQQEALNAYQAGARRLDGDKDGFPCEHLPK